MIQFLRRVTAIEKPTNPQLHDAGSFVHLECRHQKWIAGPLPESHRVGLSVHCLEAPCYRTQRYMGNER